MSERYLKKVTTRVVATYSLPPARKPLAGTFSCPSRARMPSAFWSAGPRAAVPHAGGQELAAFVTSHYITGYEPRTNQAPDPQRCATSSCGLANWVVQLQELTLRLHQRSGETFSVHVYSPCAPLLKDLQRESAEQTPLVLHRAHAGQHRDLVRLRDSAKAAALTFSTYAAAAGVLVNATQKLTRRPMLQTLHKWEIVSMVRAQVVVFLDMVRPQADACVPPLPPATPRDLPV